MCFCLSAVLSFHIAATVLCVHNQNSHCCGFFQAPVQKLQEALLSGDEDLSLDLDFLPTLPTSQVWREWFHDQFWFLWSFIQWVSMVRNLSPKPLPSPPPPPPPPSFTMSYDCHYDSDEHCGMWCLYYDWQMSVVITDMWCLYCDCHCPHDWQVSTVLMFIFWLSLWLSPWLTAECCDMSILWLSLWLSPWLTGEHCYMMSILLTGE